MAAPSSECGWRGCGQPARVDLLMSMTGKPAWLLRRVGGFCAGHAVMVGLDVQARHGGEPWDSTSLGRRDRRHLSQV
jgi:hypothetical protein